MASKSKPYRTSLLAMQVRRATIADLEDVTEIALQAWPLDPHWDYEYPYRHDFPEDTANCVRNRHKFILDDKDGLFLSMVAVIPSGIESNPGKVVAFAVWDVSKLSKTVEPGHPLREGPAKLALCNVQFVDSGQP